MECSPLARCKALSSHLPLPRNSLELKISATSMKPVAQSVLLLNMGVQ